MQLFFSQPNTSHLMVRVFITSMKIDYIYYIDENGEAKFIG